MTTTARSGSPTDEELLHIDDRRVFGYDPLAQPALIKYGVYWRPVIITLTAHRTFPCRYSALKGVSLGHFPCTPWRRFNHPETRRPHTSHRRSLLDSLSRTGPRVRQAPQEPNSQVGRSSNHHANLLVSANPVLFNRCIF